MQLGENLAFSQTGPARRDGWVQVTMPAGTNRTAAGGSYGSSEQLEADLAGVATVVLTRALRYGWWDQPKD